MVGYLLVVGVKTSKSVDTAKKDHRLLVQA